MTEILITINDLRLVGRLEHELAPKTCRYFETLLPYETKFIHVRWSGEACWVPLGDVTMPFGFENATSYPAPGQMIFYPGGFSEAEILLAYGGVQFASTLGQLAGNHFMTITEGNDQLRALGKRTLWEGAQDVRMERIA